MRGDALASGTSGVQQYLSILTNIEKLSQQKRESLVM